MAVSVRGEAKHRVGPASQGAVRPTRWCSSESISRQTECTRCTPPCTPSSSTGTGDSGYTPSSLRSTVCGKGALAGTTAYGEGKLVRKKKLGVYYWELQITGETKTSSSPCSPTLSDRRSPQPLRSPVSWFSRNRQSSEEKLQQLQSSSVGCFGRRKK